MKKSLLLLPMLCLLGTLASTSHAEDQHSPKKRPATPSECDPSNWATDPGIDYSVCEEASVQPRH